MNNEDRLKVGESWIELYDSLLKAVDEAGGANGPFQYSLIKHLSVRDFFNRIATNNIRFTFVKEKK